MNLTKKTGPSGNERPQNASPSTSQTSRRMYLSIMQPNGARNTAGTELTVLKGTESLAKKRIRTLSSSKYRGKGIMIPPGNALTGLSRTLLKKWNVT